MIDIIFGLVIGTIIYKIAFDYFDKLINESHLESKGFSIENSKEISKIGIENIFFENFKKVKSHIEKHEFDGNKKIKNGDFLDKTTYSFLVEFNKTKNLINKLILKKDFKKTLDEKLNILYLQKLEDLNSLFNLQLIIKSYKKKNLSKKNKELLQENKNIFKSRLQSFNESFETLNYISLNISNINNHKMSNNEIITYIDSVLSINLEFSLDNDLLKDLNKKYTIAENVKAFSNDNFNSIKNKSNIFA